MLDTNLWISNQKTLIINDNWLKIIHTCEWNFTNRRIKLSLLNDNETNVMMVKASVAI